jgi:hypothetical protein
MSKSLPPRPTHCTRRRMKPYIDSCECEWCVAVNQGFEDSLRDEIAADLDEAYNTIYPQVSREEIGRTREGD